MDHDDFDNVSWQNNPEAHGAVASIASPRGVSDDEGPGDTNGKRNTVGQLGPNADALDLAGVGEGVLECTVTTPIKENDGTKDAYVSYLVTTNVRSSLVGENSADHDRRPSPPFKSQQPPYVDDLQTLCSYTKHCRKNTQHVQYRLYQTSTRWSMCEEIGLGPTSHLDEPTLFIASWLA